MRIFVARLATQMICLGSLLLVVSLSLAADADTKRDQLPIRVDTFDQQTHRAYAKTDGLPTEVLRIACSPDGTVYARTANSVFELREDSWVKTQEPQTLRTLFSEPAALKLARSKTGAVRATSTRNGSTTIAAENGLFIGNGGDFELVLPQQAQVRWAPLDVRAVAHDHQGRLWFACPQGVGMQVSKDEWKLFTGADGLPYDDFTCMASGPKGVWFGTTNGAIRYFNGTWEFRHGKRWLVDNHVNDIAVAEDGTAWIATRGGVSRIGFRPMSLGDKAKFYESEIDKYHRRTTLGYVGPAKLSTPGDKETAVAYASDNDGFFNGLFLGAMSLAYAANGDHSYKVQATRTFEALAFLSEVTQGGTHPGPPGLIARAVLPTNGPNPNERDTPERDRRRKAEGDALWKVIDPRWPVDRSGKWYWKCDASADELDGHFFGYAIYFDRACETEAERDRVRAVVRRIVDHLIDHDFRLVDHDGKPTRWSAFSPKELNDKQENWEERGLNSWSMLNYLLIAHHMTGDRKYRDTYLKLAHEHGYAINGMTQPQVTLGPGSFHQADDDMSFMTYYHLLRYERDQKLLDIYRLGAHRYWSIEKYERNPFFNFVYAACCLGKTRKDHWGTTDLSPAKPWLAESVDTLKRWPLDLVDWSMSNAHRIDMVPLPDHAREPGKSAGKGHGVDGKAFRVDEQLATYLEDDVWNLSFEADGTRLREGTSFLLAYYMGLVHGFVAEPAVTQP